eukprot:6264053-Amphidinium_carterae.1
MPRRRISSKSNPCREFGHKPYLIPATQVLVSECAREIMEVKTDDTDMVQRMFESGSCDDLKVMSPKSAQERDNQDGTGAP